MPATTVDVPGNLFDIFGPAFPLSRDPIIIFTLSEPAVATADNAFVGTFENRVQVASDGGFLAKLMPTTRMQGGSGRAVFYKIKIGVREPGREFRPIAIPDFQLRVPSAGGQLKDLITAPPPPGLASFGFGPPDRTYLFYVDISGLRPIFWVNGVLT